MMNGGEIRGAAIPDSCFETSIVANKAKDSVYAVELDKLLQITVERGGSDLHLTAGAPPIVRVYGELIPLDLPPLCPADVENLVIPVLPAIQQKNFLRGGSWISPTRYPGSAVSGAT